MKSRRLFIQDCALLGVLALNEWSISAIEQTRKLNWASFAPHLQSIFHVGNVKLKLVESRRHQNSEAGAAWESFVLIFRGPGNSLLSQDTHDMEHDELGRFPIFMVPDNSTDPDFIHYAAVFNVPAGKAVS